MPATSSSKRASGVTPPDDWQAPPSAESFRANGRVGSKRMRLARRIAWNLLPPLTFVSAIPLGLLIALSALAKQVVYPPIMLMQLVPKIAVAPLFLVWLGFGLESKVLLTVLMTFFPLLLARISGFQILDNRFLYLTQSMGATSWQTFRYLRFPAALTVIFSGIKTSATIAATAAIVAEFVGANKGLGYVLLRS